MVKLNSARSRREPILLRGSNRGSGKRVPARPGAPANLASTAVAYSGRLIHPKR